MNAIYESLSYADRVSINLAAANRLEDMLTSENEDVVLPAMSFHYSRTLNYEKNMACLEILGCKYVQRCAFAEGVKTLTRLEECYKALDPEKMRTIEPRRRGRWLAETSWAWVSMKKVVETVSVAFEALNLLQSESWSQEERGAQKKLKQSLARLMKLWIATGGGRWQLPKLKFKTYDNKKVLPLSNTEYQIRPEAINTAAVIERCLSALSVVSIYDSKAYSATMSALVMIELLCIVVTRARNDPVNWRIYLGRGALMFYFHAKTLAKMFYRRLLDVERRQNCAQGETYLVHLGYLGSLTKPPLRASINYFNRYET
ncbi:hypothetical protein HDU76_006698 [Blyttiomyces sp. JEL0837]|nr:hypothetical protein HDU76_006698 [Blyttiomyces sp. JEL0837]